jgi:asparagine synthase (glutamine-hydrolysing)
MGDPDVIWSSNRVLGMHCFARLEGDFSLVLWAERLQVLLLARDIMGVKPLFYSLDDDRSVSPTATAVFSSFLGGDPNLG